MQPQQPIKKKYPNLASIGKMTVPYGGKTAYENFHGGIDLAAPTGTPVPSPVGGKVIETVSNKINGDPGYGNYIKVQTPNGDVAQFSHLSTENVQPGQQVQQGQVIGAVGSSGSAYSASGSGDPSHLDFRIVNAYKKYRNPTPYINKRL